MAERGDLAAAPAAASTYLFDNATETELERLVAIERTWDPGTFQQLDAIGVGPGWRCLEAGAVAGSVARWLAGRAGPGGRVLAVDLDARFLRAAAPPNLDVAELDLTAWRPPAAAFDLIHARMLVQHLPDPDAVVARLAAALAPGGWLVLEDSHWSSLLVTVPASPALRRLERALRQVMAAGGFDPDCGLRHLDRLRGLGLRGCAADGRVAVMSGASPGAIWYRLWLRRLHGRLLATGIVTAADLDLAARMLADPDTHWLSQVLIATRGQAAPTVTRRKHPISAEV
jgi:SAM-dependent methyltransferase